MVTSGPAPCATRSGPRHRPRWRLQVSSHKGSALAVLASLMGPTLSSGGTTSPTRRTSEDRRLWRLLNEYLAYYHEDRIRRRLARRLPAGEQLPQRFHDVRQVPRAVLKSVSFVTPKYSRTTMFRMARISSQEISACASFTSSGMCTTAREARHRGRSVGCRQVHGAAGPTAFCSGTRTPKAARAR